MSDGVCPDCFHLVCDDFCVCNCDAVRAEEEAATLRARVERMEAKLHAVARLLEKNGCNCDCEHSADEHEESCERCLACLVNEAIQ